jgi:hypothetical protein
MAIPEVTKHQEGIQIKEVNLHLPLSQEEIPVDKGKCQVQEVIQADKEKCQVKEVILKEATVAQKGTEEVKFYI